MHSSPTRLICELRLVVVLLCSVSSFASSIAQQPFYSGSALQELPSQYQPGTFVPAGSEMAPVILEDCLVEGLPAEVRSPVVIIQESSVQESGIPAGYRNGVFQKVFVTGNYLPQFDDDSLGFAEWEAGMVLALPFLRVTTPLLITPRYAVHHLDRPAGIDLPARVYDAEVTFRHLRKFGDSSWAMNAAVTLGEYSDFEASDADAFRITGQAFAVYESSPASQWVLGVVYLNREDINVVPAIGLIYQPHPDIKYEAILPRPRISWRLPSGTYGNGFERWAYLAGEFGGGIWSIERPATLTHDVLNYSDWRILVGVEQNITNGISHRLEFGYVFARELEFASATPNVRLDDSLFVRLGLTY